MPLCINCGKTEVSEGAWFCPDCSQRLKGRDELDQGKEKYHEEARTGSREPHKSDAYRESKPSYGVSYEYRSPCERQKKPRRALRITAITAACVAIIAIVIVVIDPFTPSLYTGALNFSFRVDNGLNPSPQAVHLASDHGAVDWSAVADTPWLTLSPLDGRTDEETSIALSANILGMHPGEYSATVTIFASAAKNTPIEIPVSLVVTETKETLAFKEAVGGETDSLRVHYDKPPLYSGIDLIDGQSATDPTWQQLLQFIASDDTDEQTYIEGVYVCRDFAETLHNNAEQRGIRSAWVGIDFADATFGHALNAFNTIDQGVVFVDCTGGGFEVLAPSLGDNQIYEVNYDRIAYVKIGEEYGSVDVEIAKSPRYTFYEQYEQRWEYYRSRVREYNTRAERYMAGVEEYVAGVEEYIDLVSGGTYDYAEAQMLYLDLERQEDELEREEAYLKPEADYLNQLLQDLGYCPLEPLGVVSHVEVYW